jgi:hypothetical protein
MRLFHWLKELINLLWECKWSCIKFLLNNIGWVQSFMFPLILNFHQVFSLFILNRRILSWLSFNLNRLINTFLYFDSFSQLRILLILNLFPSHCPNSTLYEIFLIRFYWFWFLLLLNHFKFTNHCLEFFSSHSTC